MNLLKQFDCLRLQYVKILNHRLALTSCYYMDLWIMTFKKKNLQEGEDGGLKIHIENKIENKKMATNNYEKVLPFVFG